MQDDFVQIDDWNYAVNPKGQVKNIRTGRILKGSVPKCGYHIHELVIETNGQKRQANKYTHVLVAHAFFGPKKPGQEVNHIDGNKLNNSLSNLEYCSRSENILHAVRTGLMVPRKGEMAGNSKLTESEVVKIKELLSLGHSPREIAKRVNRISRYTVEDIRSGRTWRHVN